MQQIRDEPLTIKSKKNYLIKPRMISIPTKKTIRRLQDLNLRMHCIMVDSGKNFHSYPIRDHPLNHSGKAPPEIFEVVKINVYK